MRKLRFFFIFSVLLLCFMSSCITPNKVNYLQKPTDIIPSYKNDVSFEEYRLRNTDRLMIRVYSMDDKANAIFNGGSSSINMQTLLNSSSPSVDLYTYQISSKGTITFPMIGELYLQGKTIRQAKHSLEELISPLVEYGQADVDVKLVGRYFSVFGTTQSGRYMITQEKINIFQALAMAGDIGMYGDRSKIKIVRETEGGTKTLTFDVRSVDIINSEFYYIEANDAIYIQDVNERFFSVTSFPGMLSFFFTTFSFVTSIFALFK